jgi:hypothetical protein
MLVASSVISAAGFRHMRTELVVEHLSVQCGSNLCTQSIVATAVPPCTQLLLILAFQFKQQPLATCIESATAATRNTTTIVTTSTICA